jgi:hypothetical protein
MGELKFIPEPRGGSDVPDFDDLPEREQESARETFQEWLSDGGAESVIGYIEYSGDCTYAVAQAWERIKTEACENHVGDDADTDAADEDADR